MNSMKEAMSQAGFKKSREKKPSWPRIKRYGKYYVQVDCSKAAVVNIHFVVNVK